MASDADTLAWNFFAIESATMIQASCHCGAVGIEMSERPKTLTSCNCSICRRVAALWCYLHPDQVRFVQGAGTTVAYVQGDRRLAMHHCTTCGCVTHWESIAPEGAERMAVHARMLNPAEIEDIPVRHFDGAPTWTYLA